MVGNASGGPKVLRKFWRIAGTLAFLSWAWRAQAPEPNQIDAEFINAAVVIWRDYFWPHSKAALRQIGLESKSLRCMRALRWLKANQRDDISLKDIRREALSQRLNAKQTEAVIESLVRAGRLKSHTAPTGGRPSHRWWVHPAPIGMQEVQEVQEVTQTAPFLQFLQFLHFLHQRWICRLTTWGPASEPRSFTVPTAGPDTCNPSRYCSGCGYRPRRDRPGRQNCGSDAGAINQSAM